mgnify:CR=1 FL=1
MRRGGLHKTQNYPNGIGYIAFLANNPRFDTAAEIVEIRYLSKSQVSASMKVLEGNGYTLKEYMDDNRRMAHLRICGKAGI